VLGPNPATPPDDVGPLLVAPAARIGRICLGRRCLVELPAGIEIGAHVRIDAQREAGELAQQREGARDAIPREAVDQHGRDPHPLERRGRPAEQLGVLFLQRPSGGLDPEVADVAGAVAAPTVRDPEREACAERISYSGNSSPAGIVSMVSTRMRSSPAARTTSASSSRKPISVTSPQMLKATAASSARFCLSGRLASDLDGKSHLLMPAARRAGDEPARFGGRGPVDAPGVRRDDVRPRFDIAGVDLLGKLGRLVQGPRSPQFADVVLPRKTEPLELGAGHTVQEDGVAVAPEPLEPQVRGRGARQDADILGRAL
jgi:hypothetical protein